MARVLMLTPQLPYPPRQGTALRNWGLLRGLAAHHELWLLSFVTPDQADEMPPALSTRLKGVAAIPQPTRAPSQRLRDLLTSRKPDLIFRLRSAAFEAQLQDWLDAQPFDWLLVEGLELTLALERVWARPTRPAWPSTLTTASICSNSAHFKRTCVTCAAGWARRIRGCSGGACGGMRRPSAAGPSS